MASLLARVAFPDSDVVHLAVSGGPDSTAMLALAVALGLHPVVHHVDHGLRVGSGNDAAAVESLCASWGVEAVVHELEVVPGADLERRCREARMSVLPAEALFAHTADDLAETVLMRMLRGTGPSALAAMSERNHPLLALRRHETLGLCEHLDLRACHDPMNDDPRFTRNRVRAEVLPLLDDVAGRDVVPLLCRLAELAGEQDDLVEEFARSMDAEQRWSLRDVPEPLARLVLRRWWRERTGLLPPDREAVERMLAVARGRARACDVVGGWRLVRRGGCLRLSAP